MKKIHIQAIVDVLALVIFGSIFVINLEFATQYWLICYIGMIIVVLLSKTILYHRQNMLFFLICSICYFVLLLIFGGRIIDVSITKIIGYIIIVPSVISCIFYIFTKMAFQLRFGLFLGLIAIVLLIT